MNLESVALMNCITGESVVEVLTELSHTQSAGLVKLSIGESVTVDETRLRVTHWEHDPN